MAYRKGVNKRYPNGIQPLCEAATSTVKSALFLSDATYRAAYRQFHEICLERGIWQKQGIDKVVWQGAVDALIRQNADINNAINVVPGTPTQLQDRRTILGTMCRKSSKNLRARRGTAAPGPQLAPGPQITPALSLPPGPQLAPGIQPASALLPPPGPQLALDPQHILGHQPVPAISADLVHDTNINNQSVAGTTYGLGAPYPPIHYAAEYQQYERVIQHVHLFASSFPPTFQPYPYQALAQSALVLEDTHDVEEMQTHHEMPIDPRLLAHDAAMRQQAATAGAQLGGNGMEVGTDGKMDVEIDEEGMEEEM